MGNTAGDSSFAFIFAQFVSAAIVTGGGVALSTPMLVLLGILILFVWSVLNLFRIENIGWISNAACLFQVVTIITLAVVVLLMAPRLNTSTYVFTSYYNDTGFSQIGYVVVLSFLFPLFGFVGYDGPAHLAEETKGSKLAAPYGIIYTVIATGISGFVLILALLYSVQDISDAINGSSGNAAIQIVEQTSGNKVAQVFSWLLVINIFFAGISGVTVTSRILFALCRDKASAFSDTLATVHPTFKSPVNSTVFLFFVQSALLLLPLNSYGGLEAFYSILSICVVGLQISYLIPIACKVLSCYSPEQHTLLSLKFKNSPLSLGAYSTPLAIVSCTWLSVTTVILLLPTSYPITSSSMNYTCVAVGVTILLGVVNWECNSKYTFQGPPRIYTHTSSGDGTDPRSGLVSSRSSGLESSPRPGPGSTYGAFAEQETNSDIFGIRDPSSMPALMSRAEIGRKNEEEQEEGREGVKDALKEKETGKERIAPNNSDVPNSDESEPLLGTKNL